MMVVPEAWYVSDEPVEIDMFGEKLKVHELSANEYGKIITRVTKDSEFDVGKYGDLLIKQMIIDPAISDPSKLKAGIKAHLIRKLETVLGISPDALKNLINE